MCNENGACHRGRQVADCGLPDYSPKTARGEQARPLNKTELTTTISGQDTDYRLQVTALPPWMELFVNGLEAAGVHVGVDLRCGDVRVPEHLLYAAKVGPARKQLRREAMTQRVR